MFLRFFHLPLLAAVLLVGCLEPVPDPPSGAAISLVVSGSEWRYLDDDRDPGAGWELPEFDDSGWPTGPAMLGFGVGDESTVLRCLPDLDLAAACPEGTSEPTLTYYLRHRFAAENPQRFSRLRLQVIKDDGVIVYLNGEVVARANMRPGVVGHGQPAAAEVDDRLVWREYRFDSRKLQEGENIFAVELHVAKPRTLASGRKSQATAGFDLELTGFDPASSAVVRGPYVQRVSGEGALVRWSTSDRVATEILWGPSPDALDRQFLEPSPKDEHRARIDGLEPGQRVYYLVSAAGRSLADPIRSFRTAPRSSEAGPVRLWVTGGLGTGDRFAQRTAQAAQRWSADRPPELWLSLGDAAFERGIEQQFDDGLFAPFADQLASTVFLPSLGNRDVRSGKDESTIVFYRLFDLPDDGQMGGKPSGSESYYSVDWGPVHLVSLNTVTGNLSPEKEMLTWLTDDLAGHDRPFTVVYFHHPPYSAGFFPTDDAEKSGRSFGVRENVLPILESHGVDLVLAGRGPSYERSFLLHGHYGTSNQLRQKMILDGGDGREDGDGAYRKRRRARGAVYVTAGGSAQSVETDFGHPAMAVSTAERGSLMIDVTADRLDLRFLTASGEVADHVTLLHE